MRLPDEPEIPAQINIVPMIDVVFAILTFFIVSTLSLTRTEGLPVNLPKAETSQQQGSDATPVTVTVDKKGQVSVDGKIITVNGLTKEVEELIGDSQDSLVIVSADENVSHGKVVAIMDKLRQVPGARLAIATQQP
jgi:biopolymer transport protein ExbD